VLVGVRARAVINRDVCVHALNWKRFYTRRAVQQQKIRPTRGEKVRAEPADRKLADVREGLLDGETEEEHEIDGVDGHHVTSP